MQQSVLKALLLVASLMQSVIWTQAQETLHLLHYNFDQPLKDGKVVNLAAANDAKYDRDGIVKTPAKITASAFDNTASTMGKRANEGGAIYPVTNGFGTVTSFTVSFWYKTDNPNGLSGNARLINAQLGRKLLALADPGARGSIMVYDKGKLTPSPDPRGSGALQVYSDADGAKAMIQESHPIYSSTEGEGGGISGQWIFVALTYDASVAGEATFRLYAASQTTGVTEVKSNVTKARELIGAARLENISFGATTNGDRAFEGWLDDIRLYAGYGRGNPDGALLPEALEQIRLEQIPLFAK